MEAATVSEIDQQIEFMEICLRMARRGLELAHAQAEKRLAELETLLATLKEDRDNLAKQERAPAIQ